MPFEELDSISVFTAMNLKTEKIFIMSLAVFLFSLITVQYNLMQKV